MCVSYGTRSRVRTRRPDTPLGGMLIVDTYRLMYGRTLQHSHSRGQTVDEFTTFSQCIGRWTASGERRGAGVTHVINADGATECGTRWALATAKTVAPGQGGGVEIARPFITRADRLNFEYK